MNSIENSGWLNNIKNNIFSNPLIGQSSEELWCTFDISKNIDCYKWELNEFLVTKWWNFNKLEWIYYKTNPNKIFQNFRELSKSKKGLSTLDLSGISNDVFMSKGMIAKNPLPIISNDAETFFVISWIQNMYDKKFIVWDRNIFVQQPSIRLNWDGKWSFFVSWEEWIATSFVNSTIYKINPDVKDLIRNIDYFFDFLNIIWIYIGDISLKIKISDQKWKGESLVKTTVHIYYWNLHLWDCWIWQFNESESTENNFLDLWFWLERINLARNKMDNYFHQYIQNKNDIDRYSDREIDAVKTICLINTQDLNLLDKHDGPYLKYKRLLKLLSKKKNYYPLIKIFYEFRGNFTVLNQAEDVLLKKILDDIELYSIT